MRRVSPALFALLTVTVLPTTAIASGRIDTLTTTSSDNSGFISGDAEVLRATAGGVEYGNFQPPFSADNVNDSGVLFSCEAGLSGAPDRILTDPSVTRFTRKLITADLEWDGDIRGKHIAVFELGGGHRVNIQFNDCGGNPVGEVAEIPGTLSTTEPDGAWDPELAAMNVQFRDTCFGQDYIAGHIVSVPTDLGPICGISAAGPTGNDDSKFFVAEATAADTDGDGVPDDEDPCTGFPNEDADGDGVCDSSDICPTDPDDSDEDSDGVCDVDDVCIGLDNVDREGATICDDLDLCEGADASGDYDADGICDDTDNCPDDYNPGQEDGDGDNLGDVCETDTDGDGTDDEDDNCPQTPNADQTDLDGDGAGDACDADDDADGVEDLDDNCPLHANPDQADFDGDEFGDVCDGDDDADGVDDIEDACPGTRLNAVYDEQGCSGEQRVELYCGVPHDYWVPRAYVRCVVREARTAWRHGLLTRRQRALLIRRAWWVWARARYIRLIRRWWF